MDRAAPTALKPLVWVIALVGALVAAGALAAAASAGEKQSSAPDPGTTNIPYVAWNGEHIRNKKCLNFRHDHADEAA